jgi:HK97 gp10 family phage protein
VSYPDGGDLKNSTYLKTFVNKNGYVYTQVGWDGYDRNGVPNALKANALESGTSKMPKRPFVRPAVNKVKRAAEFAIEQALDQKINEIMK